MRKKPKLSGPLNLATEHRFFFQTVSKSTEYPLFLVLSSPHDSRPLLSTIPLRYPLHSLPLRTRLHCIVTPVVTHPWNCDLTNSFSPLTSPQHSSASSHITPRIAFPGVVQRGTWNRFSLKDSNALLHHHCARFPTLALPSMLPPPLSWAFCPPQSPTSISNALLLVHPPARCFRSRFLHHAPSSRFLSYSLTYVFPR